MLRGKIYVTSFVSLVSVLFMSSCSALYSNLDTSEGVPYFLPKTLVRYHVNFDNLTSSSVKTVEVPDRSRPRYLSYKENWFADESLCISRSESGLLKKVHFGSQDRTADIALNVIELVAAGLRDEKGDVNLFGFRQGKCTGVIQSPWMDPYDRTEIRNFNRRISSCGYQIDVVDAVELGEEYILCPKDAICFGTKSNFNASIVGGKSRDIVHSFTGTDVISVRDTGYIRVRKAFFNTRITKLDFTNGVLTGVTVSKDSELLGLSQFPLDAIERVLAVPGNAIGLAFGNYQERLVYLQRRKELTDAGASPGNPAPTDSAVKDVLKCVDG